MSPNHPSALTEHDIAIGASPATLSTGCMCGLASSLQLDYKLTVGQCLLFVCLFVYGRCLIHLLFHSTLDSAY